jgi:hypothetical protein
MRRLLVIVTAVTAITLVEVVTACAEVYIVCAKRIAMSGVNRRGEQASCLRCGKPVRADGINASVDTLCGGVGMTFNDLADAQKWVAQNCNCR